MHWHLPYQEDASNMTSIRLDRLLNGSETLKNTHILLLDGCYQLFDEHSVQEKKKPSVYILKLYREMSHSLDERLRRATVSF